MPETGPSRGYAVIAESVSYIRGNGVFGREPHLMHATEILRMTF